MPASGNEHEEKITAGPRFDRVRSAVDESIQLLKKRGKGQGGWVKAMLDSYEAIATNIENGGQVRPKYYRGWIRAELWDPRQGGWMPRTLEGEGAIADFLMAEKLLLLASDLQIYLGQPLPREQRDLGWSPALVANLEAALEQLIGCLRSGRFISRADFAVWNRPLADAGRTRDTEHIYPTDTPEISYLTPGASGEWWGTRRLLRQSPRRSCRNGCRGVETPTACETRPCPITP